MPRKSQTDNVRKLCGCAKWKTCAHPWYLDYQRDRVRYRDNLDKLIGRHAARLHRAKDEARRAIVAKLDGRDPKGLVPADDPTLAQLLDEYDRGTPAAGSLAMEAHRSVTTVVGGRPFGTGVSARSRPTRSGSFSGSGRASPAIAISRCCERRSIWAIADGLLPRSPFRVENVPVVRLPREEARTPTSTARRSGTAPGGGWRASRTSSWRRSRPGAARRALEPAMAAGPVLAAGGALPAGGEDEDEARSAGAHVDASLRAILERRRLDPAGTLLAARGASSSATRSAGDADRIKTAWKLTLSARRSPACTSTICDGKRAHAGWMRACPWRRFSGGSDTRTSARRPRISARRSAPTSRT